MNSDTNDIFNNDFSLKYDASNARFKAINDNLHFLISLLLKDLPTNARLLCVGVGTGSEIIYLASRFPGWHFTGVDPSPDMLAVCASKLRQAKTDDRCVLIQGYLNDVPAVAEYDAILCLLVTHFIQQNDRGGIYHQMAARLKSSGQIIVAEIAGEMAADNFDTALASWAALQGIAGESAPTPAVLRNQLQARLLLLPPARTEALMIDAGFSAPHHFFQSLLIHGWAAQYPGKR
ncbi:TPA: class I SAM-dependent methyltransferase [Citrobacter freundii]